MDSPLGLRTSLTEDEINLCESIEYLKYESNDNLANLASHIQECDEQISEQKASIQKIEDSWGEVGKIRGKCAQMKATIDKQVQGIDIISQVINTFRERIAKYKNYQDLEKIRDSIIESRVSITRKSTQSADDNHTLKELVAAVNALNNNPLLRSAVRASTVGIQNRGELNNNDDSEGLVLVPAFKRLSMLSEREYLLKKVQAQGKRKGVKSIRGILINKVVW